MGPQGDVQRPRPSSPAYRRRGIGLAAVLALYGCATAAVPPLPPSPALDPARSAKAILDRRLDAPEVGEALAEAGLRAPPGEGVWGLDALTVVAWTFRGEVAGARAALVAANAGVALAAAKPPLTLSLTPEVVTSALGGLPPWIAALALGTTIETHGKRQIRAERAAADAALAEADLAAARWAVRTEVRQALLDLALSRRESALADEEARLRGDFSRWLSTQLGLGAASRPDLATADADLSRATGQAELARLEVNAADARLARALGLTPEATVQARVEPPDLDALPAPFSADRSEELRSRAALSRSDLRRLLTRYAAAVADLRAAVAARYPDLTLGPGLTYDQGDRKIVLGIGLTLPRAAASRAEIERATARVGEAGAEIETLQARTLADTAAAIGRYAETHAALREAEASRDRRAAAVANAERRRDLGAADRGDVLSAALAEIESRRAALAVRRTAVEALSSVEQGTELPIWPEAKP